jgi:hypothetical protein
VQSLEGCFASVMGLPLCNLIRCLRELGVASRADLPGACQEKLRYACPVSAAILAGVPGQDSERKIL